jgi:cytochrome c oxidase subunit 2
MKSLNLKSLRIFAVSMSAWLILAVSAFGQAADSTQKAGGSAAAGGEFAKYDAKKGGDIFSIKCSSCHYLYDSEGKGTGPALHGVTKRAPNREWFYKWVKNSQALIASGDKYANSIWDKYKPTQMTSFGDLSPTDIDNILAYVETAPEPAPKAAAADAGNVAGGVAQEELGTSYYVLFGLVIILIVAVILAGLRVISTMFRTRGERLFNWNNINGILFLVFLIVGFYWIYAQFANYSRYLLPEAASEHGKLIDNMLLITFSLTFFVFIVTQIMLFVFSFKYRKKDGVKALHYADNHRLEFFWTLIPAIVLTALVLYGAKVWTSIMFTDEDQERTALNVEVYAYQFGWNIRYSGEDNQLGKANYMLINKEFDVEGYEKGTNFMGLDTKDKNGFDDRMADEMWLPKGRPVLMKIRAQDVIHSAYMPHFRVQMNAVPGMPTQFMFTPTVTTDEMRKKTGDPKFDYILLCNKICGASHYNMKRRVKVVEPAEYDRWYKEKTKAYFTKIQNKADSTSNSGMAQLIK